jgi:NAD(P)-dependent dehydrogenase (short-subunit alcohol dehydrogenase family)
MSDISPRTGVTFDLGGKLALVTGAGQNAGAGIAEGFARQGAAVIVNDRIEERAKAVAEKINDEGGRAVAQAFDVTDLAAVKAGVAAGEKALGGRVGILVNNAGNGGAAPLKMMPFSEMPPELWSTPIDVNLYGVMNCVHAVIGGMIEDKWGRLITIASGAGTQGLNIGVSHYGAGKGGAISFMRHLAMENGPHGITANTVALGLIRQTDDPVLNRLAQRLPTRRRGNPQDVAALCIYLASPDASWFTGQTLLLNGGSTTS